MRFITFAFYFYSLLFQEIVSFVTSEEVKKETHESLYQSTTTNSSSSTPTSKARKLTDISCLLLIKFTTYLTEEGNSLHKEDLECLFDGADTPIPFLVTPTLLSDKMSKNEIISNSDRLQVSELFISNEGLFIPPEAETSIIEGSNQPGRRLQSLVEKDLVVIRMTINNYPDSPPFTSVTLSNKFFGTDGSIADAYHLSEFYRQCSLLHHYVDAGTGNNVINGIIDVTVPNTANPEVDALTAAGGWSFNNAPPYDHTMIAHPSTPLAPATVRQAYSNHWYSWCAGVYCAYPSVQVQNTGNNYGFGNSLADTNVGNGNDKDESGMMGGIIYVEDEGPKMCFNAVKSWSLGWYANGGRMTFQAGTNSIFHLYGYTEEGNASNYSDRYVLVMIDSPSNPIFLSYNKQHGFNADTKEGGDMLLVHEKTSGSPTSFSGDSYLLAMLNPGQSYSLYGETITFLQTIPGDYSWEGEHALVQIGAGSPTPTTAPTTAPTPGPFTPTTAPTTAPTPGSSAPTPSPTSAPITGPTLPPTPAPITGPTLPPTPAPITGPTLPPTPAPTTSIADDDDDAVCANTVAWKYVKKNGKKKGCAWFGKRKVRCYKKPGAIDNCPVSCNLCNKSDFKICTDKRMKKKACKNASMCKWNNMATPKQCEVL